jgi:hypothetical protein
MCVLCAGTDAASDQQAEASAGSSDDEDCPEGTALSLQLQQLKTTDAVTVLEFVQDMLGLPSHGHFLPCE